MKNKPNKLETRIIEDEKKLAYNIKKGGYEAALATMKQLGLYNEEYNRNYDVLEKLMRGTLSVKSKNKKQYSELLDSLAEVFIDLKMPSDQKGSDRADPEQIYFQSKSHALCHLFEGYPKDSSFFDEPVDKNVIQKLVDGSAKESVEVQHLGCIDRILDPLMKYNLNNLDLSKLDNKDGFVVQVDEKYGDELLQLIENYKFNESINAKYLLSAKTPRELIINLIKNGKHLDRISSNPEQEVSLLNAVKKDLTIDDLNKYFGGENTLENLTKDVNMSKNATELIKGIYVDVDGTLINCNSWGSKDYLNQGLADYLIKQKQKGKNVVIFSGGSPEDQTKRLEKINVPKDLLPVISKNALKGKILEVLIDDTKPESQGFKANNYLDPKQVGDYALIDNNLGGKTK